jgi:dihydrodipicolinate synthase/N-acetylneuraminate lyase
VHRIGVVCPSVTFFDEDDRIDWGRTEAHLEWLLEAGVNAFLAGGTCAEFYALDDQERALLIARVTQCVAGRVPVYAGVMHTSTAAAIGLARKAEEAGATGVFSVPPYYSGPPEREVVQYYRDIAGSVRIPLMAYNNPAAAGVSLSIPCIAALAQEGTIQLVKESHGDPARVHDLRALVPDSVQVIYGEDYGAFEAIMAGADGWVAGVSNFMPRHAVRLWSLCISGDVGAARDYWYKILPLVNMTSHKWSYGQPDERPDFIQIFKAALDLRGLHGGPSRRPLLPLSDEDLAYLTRLMEQADLSPEAVDRV